MRLGIFAKTFACPTLAATLDAVTEHGLDCVQFNMACAGLAPLPERIEPALCDQIREEMSARNIKMAAVSGTFNMIHPIPENRRDGLKKLRVLAEACRRLNTQVVTLCTGTRDPEDMWRRHPDHDSQDAWRALVTSMREAVRIADDTGVIMAFEPEVANVIDSSLKARRLLDELGSSRIGVVLDPANLFHAGELPRMHAVLGEAFTLLGKDIVIAHAKDLTQDGAAGHAAAGKGLLDYDYYLASLHAVGFNGPLILHGLNPGEVAGCVSFLRRKLDARGIESRC